MVVLVDRQMWESFKTLEAEAINDPDAKEFRLRLVFPLWRWVIHLFVALSEYNFEKVRPGCSFYVAAVLNA